MSREPGRPAPPHDPLEPQTDDTLQLLRPSGSGLGSRRPGAPGWSEGAVPVFAPGEVVAGRFRIVQFLAQGGMGQVYEAEDLELDERVALKTVRAEIASEARAMMRFKREVHLARRVTHPNVCRIYDVFRHEAATPADPAVPAAPSGRPALVLAMELLPGETLAARLKSDGPMTPEEALPLVEQMAAGLAAAHRAGVVHRDFNPKNVMLVPAAGAPGGVRAVVTDFGLAHAAAGEVAHDVSVTAPGMAAGTPAYMAPEQVEGADLTGAADVYALGVVLFEMLTGKWPFAGATALSTAVKRLKEAPPSPRLHVPDLPARWEAVILKCLERRPEDRYASPADVARALAGTAEAEAPSAAPAVPGAGRRRFAVIAALALAAVIALAVVFAVRPRREAAPAAGQTARPAFAVLGFKNLAGRPESDWLSVAFSEMLATELAAGRRLRAVPTETVVRAKAELELPEAQSLSPESLGRLRRLLGADLVVLGSYSALGSAGGGQVRLDVHLQSAATGETLASLGERGTEAELFDLVARVGAQLRERIGVAEPSAGERAGVAAALPGSPEAARLYAEGLARLRAQDLLAARDLLAAAAEAEPDHPLVHAALARVWSGLGDDARAVESARRAFELSEGLPREERLLVEGRFREVSGAWPEAVEIHRTLWGFFPDQLEHGLALARAQTRAGQAGAALATIAELHALPEPLAGDPRIDLEEAEAARAQSDFRRQREAAARAVERARARGARLLAAQGRGLEGSALHRLGLPREALAAYAEAERAFLAVGDRGGAARMLGLQAIVRADLGELSDARRLHERAEAIHRETGDRSSTAASLTNLGIVLRRQGDLAEAARAYREALAVFRDTGDRAAESRVLTSLANVLADQGDLAAARETYERSLAIKRELGDRGGVAGVLGNLAEIRAEAGDLDGARRLREEALAIDRELGDKAGMASDLVGLGEVLALSGDLAGAARRHEEGLGVAREIGSRSLEAWALFGLGEVLLARGELAAARERHEAALALRLDVGEAVEAAESRLALARVALAGGDPAAAERLAREAADAFAAERQTAREAAARDLLARARRGH